MPRTSLALLAALLCAGALGAPAPARAVECPRGTFLTFTGAVYAGEQAPAGVAIPPGESLGEGTLDQPKGDDACKRARKDVTVRAVGDVDPLVAVAVEGWPGTVFVLGGRCSGLEGTERWRCLTAPLRFRGESYTAVAYPAEPSPRGALDPAEALESGELGGETVEVVALAGIDPAVAVGIEGQPERAFVAPGVCPYEHFATDEKLDDLRRCLEGPLWLVFDPLGAGAGATVVATADRPVAPGLRGASVALARLSSAVDAVPADVSDAVPVGSLEPDTGGLVRLSIVVPDVEPGLYEAVLTCEACAEAFGGRTVFPAGSILVFGETEEDKGSSGPRLVAIIVGALFFVLAVLAVVAWRRGWHRRGGARRS